MNKIVFITGATSGFGEACAVKFAAKDTIPLSPADVQNYLIRLKLKSKAHLELRRFHYPSIFSVKKKYFLLLKQCLMNGKILMY